MLDYTVLYVGLRMSNFFNYFVGQPYGTLLENLTDDAIASSM